jgi:hypothetical protein
MAKVKTIRKKLFPLAKRTWCINLKNLIQKVDELGSPPLHRGGGASGTQKKKQKEVGKIIEEGFKKKTKKNK